MPKTESFSLDLHDATARVLYTETIYPGMPGNDGLPTPWSHYTLDAVKVDLLGDGNEVDVMKCLPTEMREAILQNAMRRHAGLLESLQNVMA